MNASNRKSNRHGNLALSRAARRTAVLAAGFALLSAGSALATTITPNGVTNIPSNGTVGIAGTIGTSGYYFFNGTSGGPTSQTPSEVLPNWAAVTSVFPGQFYTSTSYSSFMLSTGVSTSNYTTSVDYHALQVPAQTLATITLSNSNPIPSTFQLGVLDDNSSAAVNDTQLYLTELNSVGATVVTQTTLSLDLATLSGQNNFYTANISGASAGDVIQIIGEPAPGEPNPEHYTIGGMTFDAVAAPEPTALSLLGLGAIGLLARRRRTSASLD